MAGIKGRLSPDFCRTRRSTFESNPIKAAASLTKKKIEHSPACTGLVISGREVQERQQDDVPATSLHSSARGNK